MEALLTPRWSFLLVRGIASLAFGVVALAWPGVTLGALTLLFGAYAFVDGIIMLGLAARRGKTRHRWLLVVDGLLGIGVGVVTALWPGLTLLVLVLLIGARFLVAGVFQIATSIAMRHELDTPVLYALGGIASVALGALTFLYPAITARVLVIFIGAYAVVFGVAMTVLAFRLRRVRGALAERFA